MTAVMNRLGRSQLTLRETLTASELEAELARVTSADVERVARRIVSGGSSLTVIRPSDSPDVA
ncbi:MAG: hypothetical protein ACYC1X_08470 [Coriobacteriia bacterium]